MRTRIVTFFFFLSLFPLAGYAVDYTLTDSLQWQGIRTIRTEHRFDFQRISFRGAVFSSPESLPHYEKWFPLHSAQVRLKATLKAVKTETVSPAVALWLSKNHFADTSFFLKVSLSVARKQPLAFVRLVPLRRNPKTGQFEKLVTFQIELETGETPVAVPGSKQQALVHSVLAKGNWYKIRVDKSGVYKLTYSDLKDMGFPVDGDPSTIALYGNGGGPLPEKNNIPRPAGLTENPIEVVDGGDGSFDPGDYILFYAVGPVVWTYDVQSGTFHHRNNYYDNYAYYFLTKGSGPGLRIRQGTVPEKPADVHVNSFTDYACHEKDERNLGNTGRTWYGEVYDFTTEYSFDFHFPHVLKTKEARLKAVFASKAPSANRFLIYTDGQLQKTLNMPVTGNSYYDVGKAGSTQFTFAPTADKITVKTIYQRSSSSAVGYLDYIELNVQRALVFDGGQMNFRNLFTAGTVAQYRMQTDKDVQIWDVSLPLAPRRVKLQKVTGGVDFSTDVAPYKAFVAFDGTVFYKPKFVEKVENQDLHAVKNIDLLIVAYPDFLDQARRLADFHREKDGIKVFVTTPQKIYNEFSSGAQDVTAIRDFVKHVYDQSDAGRELRYLLLFGDASFDYKDRVRDNTNFVPCWESVSSLNTISSVATDDYYGYLDDGEGTGYGDKVDIGIGRFPVDTPEEAKEAVDKTIRYATNTPETLGPWRNRLTFVADDGDYNRHLNDAETLTGYLDKKYPVYGINKLYLDAYPQISTPSGQRAPALNKAINSAIDAGTLIFNYSGHGGEVGLGHERFMTIADINSWNNKNKLTVFITATCEFTRYDNPERVSAGELVFMNPQGGAVALFTTTRATYASANLALNMAIFKNNMFEKINGSYPCFGDVIRRSKVLGGNNDKKFLLVGDPALHLAYPENIAKTTFINAKAVTENETDTLKALSKVRVQGEVLNANGQPMKDYNGTVFSTVFDKKTAITTLRTDPDSRVATFYVWNSILFKGEAAVRNGNFDFSFVVPKDIAYKFGKGRMSFYFDNGTSDGHGYNENIVVGGYDDQAPLDTTGPDIRLFMNDTTFSPGGITHADPVLFARFSDQSGINTTGNSIGHDIVATLDNDVSQSYNLNAFYIADEGDFTKGTLRFQLKGLSAGKHVIRLKAWDLYNNSSVAELPFVVDPAATLVIDNLMNFPNPVTDATDFVFHHNQAGKLLQVRIDVYKLDGRRVKTIREEITPPGFSSGRIHWNCTGDTGKKLGRGMYVYQLVVTTPGGQTKVLRNKLVFIR
jgi:hypothetical protein